MLTGMGLEIMQQGILHSHPVTHDHIALASRCHLQLPLIQLVIGRFIFHENTTNLSDYFALIPSSSNILEEKQNKACGCSQEAI